ncbi:MAG: lamin tail domain-containing protein, partial [Bacteroidota bacterium]
PAHYICRIRKIWHPDVGIAINLTNFAITVAIKRLLSYLFTPAPDGISFNVVGPLYYSFGNFKIEPRDANDVVRYGCTDDTFPNYDPLALVDDGSCANISGCTDPNAENYNPAATVDDGSCIINGCTDDTALNYDATATVDDGSCYFTEPNLVINEFHYNPCTAQGDDNIYEFLEIYNADMMTVDLSGYVIGGGGPQFTFPEGASIAAGEYIIVAQTAVTYDGNGYQVFEWEFGNLSNTSDDVSLFDAFNNIIDTVTYDDGGSWPTAPDGGCASLELVDFTTDNADPANWQASFVDNGTPGAANSTPPVGCTDPTASNYDENAIIDDGSCVFEGCTDPTATNFDPNATVDDGSCLIPGCTYDAADNYDMAATVDDGSCQFTGSSCPGDFNDDAFINAGDMIAFL